MIFLARRHGAICAPGVDDSGTTHSPSMGAGAQRKIYVTARKNPLTQSRHLRQFVGVGRKITTYCGSRRGQTETAVRQKTPTGTDLWPSLTGEAVSADRPRIWAAEGRTAMKIERKYTQAGQDAYAGIEFVTTTSEIRNPDGSTVFNSC